MCGRPRIDALREVGRILVEGGSRDRWRRYNVKNDGELVGKIGRGDHLAVEVTPGSLHVQARIDWTGSPHVNVNVADRTDVHLTVRPAGNPFLASLAAADLLGTHSRA